MQKIMDHIVQILELSKLVPILMNIIVSQVLHHRQNQLSKNLMIHHYVADQIQIQRTKIINTILIHSTITIRIFVHTYLQCHLAPIIINILIPSCMLIIIIIIRRHIHICINNNSIIQIYIQTYIFFINTIQ